MQAAQKAEVFSVFTEEKCRGVQDSPQAPGVSWKDGTGIPSPCGALELG